MTHFRIYGPLVTSNYLDVYQVKSLPKSWTIGENTTRARKKAATHQRILEAAAELFESKGFYETKASDIAKAAKVSAGSIYAHFGSPENIMAVLHERLISSRTRRLTAMRENWPMERNSWELLIAMLNEVWGMNKIKLQMENVSAYHSWLWVCSTEDFKPIRETYRTIFEELGTAAEMAKSEGLIPTDVDVPDMVEIMAAIFFQGIQEARTNQNAFMDQHVIFMDRIHKIFRVKQSNVRAGAA